jgi:hypothetical protein
MGFKLADATNASCMRRKRGELRLRFVRAATDVLLFFFVTVLVLLAVLFFVAVLFADEGEAED